MLYKIFAVISILLLFTVNSCGNKEISSLNDISFPPGLDDSAIDSLRAGKKVKENLAVLDFEGAEKLKGKVDATPADILVSSLEKTKLYNIIERNKLESIIKEQNLQLSGIINEATAVEMGNLAGAEYLISGTITSASESKVDKFAYTLVKIEVGVDVRIISTTTGKVVLSGSATGVQEEKIISTSGGTLVSGAIDYNSAYGKALRTAIEKVGQKVSDLSILCGIVLSVSKDGCNIDLGTENGLATGNKFIIVRLGDPIVHPVTKKNIGWNKKIIGTMKVTKIQKNISVGSILEKDEKTPIIAGDLVIQIKDITEGTEK